jgi:uncharacterized repeat protein (TIGR02543 family)
MKRKLLLSGMAALLLSLGLVLLACDSGDSGGGNNAGGGNTYTVTFDGNGGTSPSSQTVNAGSSTTLPSTTRSGYTLNGWYTSPSGGTKVGNAGASYTPSASVTLYAQWTQGNSTTYTVTVETDIAHGSISASPTSGTAGTTVTLSNTADSGYAFYYYTVSGERITGNSFVLSDNVTVSAMFDLEPNLTTLIGSPSVILYLNNSSSSLVEGGRTEVNGAGSGTYTVSIADGNYSQITWYLNGRAVAGETETSIVLSKQTSGVYLVTVEAALVGGDKNTGSHTFVVK